MSAALWTTGSRGPRGTSVADSPVRSLPLAANGPLDPGPLGPLDPRPRLELAPLVSALEARWAADPDTGSFVCPLPGHERTGRLGTPPDDPDGDVRLLCCGGRWRSLGEVRAAEAYGIDGLRSNIEAAVWLRRLAHEVGGFDLAPVYIPQLPPDAPLAARLARDGFALLIGLRWADLAPRPVAFSVRFCAAWCGLPSFRAAHEAISYLIESGVVREAGTVGRARLFMPGRLLREVNGSNGGAPPDPPEWLPPTSDEDEPDDDALVAALVEAFDAEEAEQRLSQASAPSRAWDGPPPCPYERHRAHDWLGDGGRRICGICHPPAGGARRPRGGAS